MPSAPYMLLANPSWMAKEDARRQVLAGLQTWEFDPNETHQGCSMLRALLCSWPVPLAQITESELLLLVKALLDKGADPEGPLAVPKSPRHHIRWETLQATKMLLATGPGATASDPLPAALFKALRSPGSARDVVGQVGRLLGGQHPWSTKVEGVSACAWIALHANSVGPTLPGWGGKRTDAYNSDDLTLALRISRLIIQSASSDRSLSLADRLVCSLGLNMQAARCNSTVSAVSAAQSATNTALRILGGMDSAQAFEQLSQDPAWSPYATRLGATMVSAAPVMEAGETWLMVSRGLGLVRHADRIEWSQLPVNWLYQYEVSPPSSDFWEALPPTPATRTALLGVLTGFPARKSMSGAMAMLTDLQGWLARCPPMPPLDYETQFRGASALDGAPPGFAQTLQAICLGTQVEPAPLAQAPRPRL